MNARLSRFPLRLVAAGTLLLAAATAPAGAVVLDDEDVVTVVLSDGTQVVLYGAAESSAAVSDAVGERPNVVEMTRAAVAEPEPEDEAKAKVKPIRARYFFARDLVKPKDFYSLPVNLRLSRRPDGTPEFLFLKFTTDERETAGGTSGAVVHFLMEWGLTPEQEAELRTKLAAQRPGARLKGAVPMEPAADTGTFQIVSATLSDETFTRSVVTSGKAPLVPGGRAAAASRLTAQGAQLLAASFERARSITDVSIALDFAYQTLTPAARGSITFDWEKLQAERQRIEAEYTATEEESVDWGCFLIFCAFWEEETYSYSYDELQEFYKFLEEKRIVRLQFDELVDDDRVEKIRQAFFDYFLQNMTRPVAPPEPEGGRDPYQVPDIQKGSRYTFNREIVQGAFERRTDRFSLEYRFAVKRPFQIVGNLASWYDGVRDNPKCVAAVNLADPFFQHRDIRFILDLDAKEMFDEAVNFVTVNVRKKRSTGAPFERSVTIDAEHVKTHGITQSLTYARDGDENTELYEYQVKWSLKGGHEYPTNSKWLAGRWEGVTLAPPVVPRTIEVEGDLEDMRANGITRITVQIHYPKFGEEVEENIHLSPARDESLVARKIFVDRGSRGYAYRLIVHHRTEGRFALPWSARVGDDYVYAAIPPELLKEESPLKTEARAAAADIAASAREKVLEKFRELIGGTNG